MSQFPSYPNYDPYRQTTANTGPSLYATSGEGRRDRPAKPERGPALQPLSNQYEQPSSYGRPSPRPSPDRYERPSSRERYVRGTDFGRSSPPTYISPYGQPSPQLGQRRDRHAPPYPLAQRAPSAEFNRSNRASPTPPPIANGPDRYRGTPDADPRTAAVPTTYGGLENRLEMAYAAGRYRGTRGADPRTAAVTARYGAVPNPLDMAYAGSRFPTPNFTRARPVRPSLDQQEMSTPADYSAYYRANGPRRNGTAVSGGQWRALTQTYGDDVEFVQESPEDYYQ